MVNKKRKLLRELLYLVVILGLVFAIVGLAESWNDSKKETDSIRDEKDKIERNLERLDEKYQQLKKVKKNESKPKVAEKPAEKPPEPQTATAPVGEGCERFRPLIEQYNWNVSVAMNVMKAESGCNPNAVSPTNDHGLFQLHGIPIYDPAENVAYAYHNKYMAGGWSHWTVCTNGIVRCW